MIEIPSEVEIQCSAEKIFDVIVDFRGQDRWLANSSAYHGTTDISSNPASLGTTYLEPAPSGVRRGTVTELERPTKITCHQPMTMKMRAGTLDATMRCTLTPGAESTHVKRVVTLQVPWSLKLIQPMLVRAFRAENARTLNALKTYAETLA